MEFSTSRLTGFKQNNVGAVINTCERTLELYGWLHDRSMSNVKIPIDFKRDL